MKIDSFNFFRTLGPILIFLSHITLYETHIGGGVAVEMFFVLSGFGMTLGYGNNTKLKFKPYIQKRLSKLYPIYFITLCMGGVYMMSFFNSSVLRTLTKLPFFISCSQTVFPFITATGFNSPAWYVATSIWIYILFYLFMKSGPYKWWGVIIYVAVLYIIYPFIRAHNLVEWFYYFSPYSRFKDFLIGVVAAILFKKYPIKVVNKTIITIFETLSLIIFTAFIIYEQDITDMSIVGIAIASMLYLFGQEKGYISILVSTPIFYQFAKYSYAFYLIHYLVIMTLTKVFVIEHGLTLINIGITILMFMVSSMLAFLLTIWTKNIGFSFIPFKQIKERIAIQEKR